MCGERRECEVREGFASAVQCRVPCPTAAHLCRSIAKRVTSCSTVLRSVMSWPTPITPIGVPLLSTRVVALRSTSTFLPSREYKGNSKLSVPWWSGVKGCKWRVEGGEGERVEGWVKGGGRMEEGGGGWLGRCCSAHLA